MKFIQFINVKIPTTVGILTFISRINDFNNRTHTYEYVFLLMFYD